MRVSQVGLKGLEPGRGILMYAPSHGPSFASLLYPSSLSTCALPWSVVCCVLWSAQYVPLPLSQCLRMPFFPLPICSSYTLPTLFSPYALLSTSLHVRFSPYAILSLCPSLCSSILMLVSLYVPPLLYPYARLSLCPSSLVLPMSLPMSLPLSRSSSALSFPCPSPCSSLLMLFSLYVPPYALLSLCSSLPLSLPMLVSLCPSLSRSPYARLSLCPALCPLTLSSYAFFPMLFSLCPLSPYAPPLLSLFRPMPSSLSLSLPFSLSLVFKGEGRAQMSA